MYEKDWRNVSQKEVVSVCVGMTNVVEHLAVVLFCQKNRPHYKTPLKPHQHHHNIRGTTAVANSVLVTITVW
jgi:hypothetical protein